MSQHSPFSNLEVRLRRIGGTLGGGMRRELIGGALAILGILLLIPVLRYNPGAQAAPPLLVLLAGWTAPLVAIATITVGGVLLLGPRAGYLERRGARGRRAAAAGAAGRHLCSQQ